MTEPDLSLHPNALTTPLSVTCQVKGYQNFYLGPDGPFKEDSRLWDRQQILSEWLTPESLKGRSFLDLGAAQGYWSFLACHRGADFALAVEMDHDYLRVADGLARACSKNLVVLEDIWTVGHRQFDVVNALAIIHWLFCCTDDFGNLDSLVDWLAARTEERLHVEWVAPEDPAIVRHGHIRWRPELVTGPYTEEAFLEAMNRNFREVIHCGDYKPTRKLYVGLK